MWWVDSLAIASTALLIESCCGYPGGLFRAVGHPVTWMGRGLAFLERKLNRAEDTFSRRKALGVATLTLFLIVIAAIAFILASVPGLLGFVVVALVAATLPAQRSLYRHVAGVADALDAEGLTGGRAAVAHIVGRNPAFLDEAGVARAAIESLAENFADGVVAPAFWLAAAGLPGGTLYKAINTADSMIGHRSPRYLAFGWAAARLDDFVNLPASRLAAFWIVLAALFCRADAGEAFRTVFRDAHRHRSPNAGWPESAMAGALRLALNGPRVYGDTRVDDAFMGNGRPDATAADIRRALRLYRTACALQIVVLLALSFAVAR